MRIVYYGVLLTLYSSYPLDDTVTQGTATTQKKDHVSNGYVNVVEKMMFLYLHLSTRKTTHHPQAVRVFKSILHR